MKFLKARTSVVLALGAVLVCSCAPHPASSKSNEKDSQLPVIGHLEFRDRTVTILSGASGPVYTVTAKEGRRLAAQLGEKELHARFPELYEKIKTSVAAGDARF